MATETNGALTPAAETPPAAATKDEIKQEPTPQDEASKPEPKDSESPPKDETLQPPATTAGEVMKTPFTSPLDSCKPEPPAALTSDQQSKYEELLKTVSEWTTVPTTAAKNSPTDFITEEDCMFMTRECLLRYLRATKWDLTAAANRLKGTLTWRREYGLAKLTPDYISVENETGKQIILGYDVSARPCLYLNPAKQNTEYSERQVQHLVFMLERVIDLMGPDQESLALVGNFGDTRAGQNATIGQGREVLNILQNHYPERLGRALVVNIPFLIYGFFKLITPFIDPLTRAKLKFNEDLTKHIPSAQLPKSLNGEVEFEYDHSTYWPALNELCEQRQYEYYQRWAQGGKVIGEHENYLKGGSDPGLKGSQAPVAAIEEKMERLEVNLAQTNNDQSVDAITPA